MTDSSEQRARQVLAGACGRKDGRVPAAILKGIAIAAMLQFGREAYERAAQVANRAYYRPPDGFDENDKSIGWQESAHHIEREIRALSTGEAA